MAGCTFSELEKRHAWREQFESMRLLYVAATRAEDRLILSGATEELSKLSGSRDSWLKWIWQALDLENRSLNDVIELDQDVQIKFVLNVSPELESTVESEVSGDDEIAKADSFLEAFPLLKPITPVTANGIQRFSVTQLINYQRCARQFYFDRVLQLPTADELAVWNNAEAPEPPANLTATLKGAVIHRFCERFTPEQNVEECLRRSFDEVVRLRQSDLADRLVEIDAEAATKDLLPLAMNYLRSDLFSRVELARSSVTNQEVHPAGEPGLWSELSFRIRRPLGVVSGAIDKLLVTQANDHYEVEIIDFKTNRLALRPQASGASSVSNTRSNQFAFDFDVAPPQPNNALAVAAHDYQLQMQAYALAIRELLPSLKDSPIRVTLHFLEPNLEYHLADELLTQSTCEAAIDSAMHDILRSSQPQDFSVNPATHCRTCSFLKVCAAGREFVRELN